MVTKVILFNRIENGEDKKVEFDSVLLSLMLSRLVSTLFINNLLPFVKPGKKQQK